MADISNELFVDWWSSPRIITVKSPRTDISIQDLVDSLRILEADNNTMDDPYLISAGGKEDLGDGVSVGITATLRNALLSFETRTGPDYTQCKVSGGNLVALESDLATYFNNPIDPTAFTQIVIAASSSATIAETSVFAYGDRVYIDVINGTSGTEAPQGTSHYPVDNLADALIIAVREKIDTLDFKYILVIESGEDISNYTVIADRSIGNVVTVNPGAITNNTYFENLTVSGTMNGTVRYTTCVMGNIYNFDGGAKNSLLTGNITITGNGLNYFTDCDVYITDPTILREINVDGHTLNLIRCRGGYKITNKTSTNTLAIDLVAGIVEVASDCLAGQVFIGGIAEVIDNSAEGCTVMIKSMSHEAISQNVWDEPLTGESHNIATTAGRRMRTLSSSVILNENALGPGTGNNQIQFGPDASIDEGAYDPAVISIINGTGAGQTRNILQYNGATKTATVDRDWRVNPDDTSEYVIVSDAGREHVNEGLVTDGGIDTISLNIDASSIDEAYTGQVIFIRSGTGQDQACRCKSYDGATRTATICSDWAIIPDTTSGYVVLPTAAIKAEALGEAIWTDPRAVDLIADMAFVKQIEGGRWHIIDNQMIFYEDDNITEIARFNLFDAAGTPVETNVLERVRQ